MGRYNFKSSAISKGELIEKLKANRDSNGYFTLPEVAEESTQGMDVDLTQEVRAYFAIEKFQNSLEHKPVEKVTIDMVF